MQEGLDSEVEIVIPLLGGSLHEIGFRETGAAAHSKIIRRHDRITIAAINTHHVAGLV